MNDDEFHAERERLESELEAANAAFLEVRDDPSSPEYGPRYLRRDLAMHAVAENRRYWRQVGIDLPDDHPNTRPSHGGLGISGENITRTETS